MQVTRTNSLEISYRATVEPKLSYGSRIEVGWSTGGMERGAGWRLAIGSGDFKALARLMMAADGEAALDAFAAAIRGRRQRVPRG